MSTFKALARNPKTMKMELALFADDKFGRHKYGVAFDSEPELFYQEDNLCSCRATASCRAHDHLGDCDADGSEPCPPLLKKVLFDTAKGSVDIKEPDWAPAMNAKSRIAFDVDGTLIRKTHICGDVPRYEIIELLRTFASLGHTVFVWSGGGEDYAEQWLRKLGLIAVARIIPKRAGYGIDLAFDDQEANLATVTIRV